MAVGDSIGGAGFNQGFEQVLSAEVGQPAPYREPYAMRAIGGMPGMLQGMAATTQRGANTIMSGGWADRRARRRFFRGAAWDPEIGTIRGSIANNNLLFPRTWSRYASQGMFFEDKYSPVGGLANTVNWAGRKAAERGMLGEKLGWLGTDNFIEGGLLSQISAAERLGSSSIKPSQMKWFGNYLDQATASGRLATGYSTAELADPVMRRRLAYMSIGGRGGQFIGGYAAGARDLAMPAMEGTAFARGLNLSQRGLRGIGITEAEAAGKIGIRRGIQALGGVAGEQAGKRLAMEGAGALAARGALAGAKFLPVIGWMWTAYDIAKAVVPRAPEFAADVYRSYTGWGNRRMFGAPFQTNEAAITTRQRGVMAIQNSRMNARSVIGAEAGGIHAYFG